MLNTKRLASASSRLVRMMSHVTSSEAASVPWKEIRIPVPWGHIAGKEWGVEDGEPVLGLHGWLDNSATLDRLAPLLPLTRLRLISLDLPGHGQSSHFPQGIWYRWSDYVASVARVVDCLNWSKFSFLSHSMGAQISLVYAGCYPQRVKRMITLDAPRPSHGPPRVFFNPPKGNDSYQWDVTEIYRDWIHHLLKLEKSRNKIDSVSVGKTMDKLVDRLVANMFGFLTPDSARVLLNRGTRLVSREPDVYVLTRDRRLDILDFLLPDDVYDHFCTKITCDMLSVVASDSVLQEFKGYEYSQLDIFKERTNSFRMESIEGTHHVHLNNPERMSSMVGEYLLG